MAFRKKITILYIVYFKRFTGSIGKMGLLSGKKGLIMGVANERSIAWGIAKACSSQGAKLAFTYQGDALKKRIIPLAESVGSNLTFQCDVADQDAVKETFAKIKDELNDIDFLVHAIGFSDKNELRGRYIDTSKKNFLTTMDISVYSFTAVAQEAEKIMPQGGSVLTLTYYGSEKVLPHYNVMGVAKAALEASVRYMAMDLGKKNIRVNAISAGTVKTLAASGIGDFRYIMKWNELNSPLRRNVTQDEVGNASLFLLSDLSSGITGENLHVDAGYNIVGMKAEDAPDIDVVTGRKE
tara:strand:- start:2087 stop:2974 length:888 start_codon:yes stop_codon:yes gene_type:complete